MDCDICGKAFGPKLPLHCATCARNAIYPLRYEQAATLIDRETLNRHVKAVIEGDDTVGQHISLGGSTGGALIDRHESSKTIELQRIKAETAESEERIALITGQSDLLRKQLEETRKEIATRKAALAQRHSDLASATHGVEARRANELDKVKQGIMKIEYKWDRKHQETVEARMYLCRTAAKLAGLKQTRRKTKDGGTKDVYNIGPGQRIRIYDLRDLNNASFEQLSASLTTIAQLLVLVSHYLAIRLPAEITLPHKDYPLPTIFSPLSSYQSRDVPFPGSTPTQSSSNSPDASRTLENHRTLPRPRILHLDRPLIELATQDAPAYSMFLEGVALLAYDVAWLCRTQGMPDEFNDWEDVCPIGRNLWRLLIQQESRSPAKWDTPVVKDGVVAGGSTPTKESTHVLATTRPAVVFGEYSHGTAHSFLGAAGDTAYLRTWKLSSTKIIDNLKALLLADQQGQEWEVLDQKEWHGMEDGMAEEPVVVGPRRRDTEIVDDARSILSATTTTAPTVGSEDAQQQAKARGVNGWTKLKSRAGEASK
ncbi:hypothetical protein AOQ84DRAFT_390778 [Glonium stellatum]|uniref:Autophagy-related protein 14 n=1 Tax=Glonium stellatum TaxID=574774 RepID=A0A8E2EWG6_9PEZI|nr:hypothetical protein AOQ84DRAFT_390778 [Glonium stellatum]